MNTPLHNTLDVRVPTAAEERALFATLHDSANTAEARSAARDELIVRNLPLVTWALKHVRHPFTSPDDLFGHGVVALIEAVDRFDPARGVRFATMATQWVKARTSQSVDRCEFRIRIPAYLSQTLRGQHKGPKRADLVEYGAVAARTSTWGDYRRPSITEARSSVVFDPEFDDTPPPPEFVAALLKRLPWRQAALLRRYFGIGRPAQTLTQIAKATGVSPQAVQSRIARVLASIRGEVAA